MFYFYFRAKVPKTIVKGTIKRAKKQKKFVFSEPTNAKRAEYARILCLVRRRKTKGQHEYLRTKFKDIKFSEVRRRKRKNNTVAWFVPHDGILCIWFVMREPISAHDLYFTTLTLFKLFALGIIKTSFASALTNAQPFCRSG